jgi:hypothetical protein
MVVIADGIFGDHRILRRNQNIAARLGDCRWNSDERRLFGIWWDFGTTRIQRGADIAIQDGVNFGRKLVHQIHPSAIDTQTWQTILGHFAPPTTVEISTRNRQRKIIFIIIFPLVLSMIYRTIQQFERF